VIAILARCPPGGTLEKAVGGDFHIVKNEKRSHSNQNQKQKSLQMRSNPRFHIFRVSWPGFEMLV